MSNAIKEFFKKKFFFKIDTEERDQIRQRVMQNDHKVYMILLPIIMILEFVVLLISFADYGFGFNKVIDNANLPVLNAYRSLYVFFIVICIICLFFALLFSKEK